MLQTLLQDIRFAARLLVRQPSFTAVAVLSLGIAIGANTAVFSVAHALLLRPLPYADADRLTILWSRSPGLNIAEDWFSTGQYFDIRSSNTTFEDLGLAIGQTFNLTDREARAERVGVIRVSSNLLPLLGATALHGRLLEPAEDRTGLGPVAVLGYRTWVRRYGADPAVLGRTMNLNGQPAEIVGILPEHFSLPREVLPTLGVIEEGDIFLPLPMNDAARSFRGREDYNIVAKLKPGATAAQAQAEMDVLTARLRSEFPDTYPPNGGLTFSVVPLLEQVVGDVRRTIWILSAAVGVVLLIACVNVANLLLARGLARRRELTVRAAIGASPRRVTQQLLTESLLLALAGAAVGVVLAVVGIGVLRSMQPPDVPRLGNIAITMPVLAYTVLLSLGSAIAFGMAPIVSLRRMDLQASLRDERAGSGSFLGRHAWRRRALVAAELAMSVILLVGAGLLVRSLAALQRVPPGFTPERVLTFELSLVGPKYPAGPVAIGAFDQLWKRLDALPGVVSSGGITSLPMSGYFAWGPITIDGFVPPGGQDFINADQRVVGGRYFEAMGIPIVRGRAFTEADRPDGERVVIVDERLANEYWPGADPIGKRLRLGPISSGSTNWMTVVGVAGRVKQYGLDADARIAIYNPQTQLNARSVYVVMQTTGDPAALIPAVRQAIEAFDPDLPIYRIKTMDRRVSESLARPRFAATLLGAFAAVALALAAIGTFGVMAYMVSSGTREIGIRMALGATERGVLRQVLGVGGRVAAVGLVAGAAGAWAFTRLMRGMLFGVDHTDPISFAIAGAILAAVALAATLGPARRAARVDPTIAMRAD